MAGNRRAQIAMSQQEIEEFLAEERTLVVGSHGRSGHPHVVPMWFSFLDEEIVFWTYRSAQKVINLRRDSRASCLVEAGESYELLRGVLMEGLATVSSDPEDVERVGLAIAGRYGGNPDDEAVRDLVRQQAGKRVAVTFECTSVVSWDHRKLASGVY